MSSKYKSKFNKVERNLKYFSGTDGWFYPLCSSEEVKRKRAELVKIKKKSWFLQAQSKKICEVCQKKTDHLTIDHIVPLSRGGTNQRGNIRFICASCNREKGMGTTVDLMWDRLE